MTHWEPLYRDYFSEDHDKSYSSKKEQNQMKFACLLLFTLPECPPRISLDGRYVSKTVTFLSSFISFRFLRGLRVFCHQWQIWKEEKKRWRIRVSILVPPACEAGALPLELIPQLHPRENRSTKGSASLATVLINFVFYYSSHFSYLISAKKCV